MNRRTVLGARLAAEQPAPVLQPHSAPVMPLLRWQLQGPIPPPDWLRDLIESRIERGQQSYGHALYTYDGRDPLADLAQELADALAYARKLAIEQPSPAAQARVVRLQLLLLELAQDPAAGAPPPDLSTTEAVLLGEPESEAG